MSNLGVSILQEIMGFRMGTYNRIVVYTRHIHLSFYCVTSVEVLAAGSCCAGAVSGLVTVTGL